LSIILLHTSSWRVCGSKGSCFCERIASCFRNHLMCSRVNVRLCAFVKRQCNVIPVAFQQYSDPIQILFRHDLGLCFPIEMSFRHDIGRSLLRQASIRRHPSLSHGVNLSLRKCWCFTVFTIRVVRQHMLIRVRGHINIYIYRYI